MDPSLPLHVYMFVVYDLLVLVIFLSGNSPSSPSYPLTLWSKKARLSPPAAPETTVWLRAFWSAQPCPSESERSDGHRDNVKETEGEEVSHGNREEEEGEEEEGSGLRSRSRVSKFSSQLIKFQWNTFPSWRQWAPASPTPTWCQCVFSAVGERGRLLAARKWQKP